MHGLSSRRFFTTLAVLALLSLGGCVSQGQVSPALADDDGGLGKQIAGTYLGVQKGGAQILQITEDGNLSAILSIQFSGGAAGLQFSNALGSWKRTGARQIAAKAIDVDFRPEDGAFAGVAVSTYVIKFDETLQTATMTSQGAVFPPGVNPLLDPAAVPIHDGGFTHSDEFHRLTVDGED